MSTLGTTNRLRGPNSWPLACFLFAFGWDVDALQSKLSALSVEAQSKLEKETAKKEAKADAKALAEAKKKEVSPSHF